MARHPKRKLGARLYCNYTETVLNEALSQIAEGNLTILDLKKYSIPYGTLHNKFHGKHMKVLGCPTTFSESEEKAFVIAFTKCAKWGYPLDLNDIRYFAKSYLDQMGCKVDKFSNNLPGIDGTLFFK